MANVLNRQTLEYLESVNTPDYPETDWVINPDVSIAQTVPWKYLKLVGDALTEMSVAEQRQVDLMETTGGKSLEECRLYYLGKVDSACEDRIANGNGAEVLGTGKKVSTSIAAQIKWIGWASIADNWEAMGMTYPFRVRTKWDDDYVEISDASQVKAVFAAIAAFIAATLQEAEAIKSTIQGAATVQEMLEVAVPYIEAAPSFRR